MAIASRNQTARPVMNNTLTDHTPGAEPMSRFAKILLAGSAALFVGIAILVAHLIGPRVVARAHAADGTEMCIVQKCNWSGELFTTHFVFRKPGAGWRRFYYDHQDDYWGRSRVSLNPDKRVAVFFRGGAPAVTFDWATETYTLHRWRRIDTESDPMPAGWSPRVSLFSKP